jgi:hypothetical protein
MKGLISVRRRFLTRGPGSVYTYARPMVTASALHNPRGAGIGSPDEEPGR